MRIIFSTVEGEDFVITNESFVLSPDSQMACLQFIAIDDSTVESTEYVTITVTAEGEVVGNTTVAILDNDGMMSNLSRIQ